MQITSPPPSDKPKKPGKKEVLLIASGDLRESANPRLLSRRNPRWRKPSAKRRRNTATPFTGRIPFDSERGHGFIGSQRQGLEVFRGIHPQAPLIVAEAVWQYSHHVLPGMTTHQGPILTVANWSGQWPGLVGMLNLNGSLTKAGVSYSTLWSEDFTDNWFAKHFRKWLTTGRVKHRTPHVAKLADVKVPGKLRKLGEALAEQLQRDKAILGVFDEGCMGMFNAIIPDHLLNATGVFKERLSQSALYHEMLQTSDEESAAVRHWLENKGLHFVTGPNHETDLTDEQIHLQCKMYLAAVRIADDFGCDAVGIQYQQGLKDLAPASDLVEGMLNNVDRPPVPSRDGKRVLFEKRALPHFNEVDECAGLDALLTNRVHAALGQPVENTLHDLRWGDYDAGGDVEDYVWVLLISGAAPPAHFIDGWRGARSERQPAMYFPSGGGTLKGISKPGEIVWSRIFIEKGALCMDLGRASVVKLSDAETERRWQATTPQWPIMHAVLHGVDRDQMMARHKANHIQVAYAENSKAADAALLAKAAAADALGMKVYICGTDLH